MNMSASLLKAVTEANKECYKKEGRCFFCRAQGHVSCSCLKKTTTSQKSLPAKIVAVTEEVTVTLAAPNQMTVFTPNNVLNYLKDLLTDEYQQMAEAWGKMMTEEDFSQA